MGHEHVQEASATINVVTGFSAYLHSIGYSVEQFKRELDEAVAHINVNSNRPNAAAGKPKRCPDPLTRGTGTVNQRVVGDSGVPGKEYVRHYSSNAFPSSALGLKSPLLCS